MNYYAKPESTQEKNKQTLNQLCQVVVQKDYVETAYIQPKFCSFLAYNNNDVIDVMTYAYFITFPQYADRASFVSSLFLTAERVEYKRFF